MKAMLFSAGLGTRLRPLTNDRPKALVEVGEKSLLEWNLLRLKSFGITEVVVNVHHFADLMIDFLHRHQNFGLNLHISDERDLLLETGGGLQFAAPLLRGNEPILLCNVDILTSLNPHTFLAYHQQQQGLATLAVRQRETSRYLLWDRDMRLVGWQNVKTDEIRMSRPQTTNWQAWAFSGYHIIEPDILKLIEEEGKFSIIDVYLRLAREHNIFAWDHSADAWLDVGKPHNIPLAEAMISDVF
ncbi:MAG: nucleotidyltransferase family protein [Bacteroidota bacterium]